MAVPALPSPEEVQQSLRERSAKVDQQVLASYSAALQPHFPSGIALVAVGGFGRTELFPQSDVDLLLIVESEKLIEPVREAVSTFQQTLWDGGLRPSHAVQTVAYCAMEREDNVELTISLLDRRYLAGDPALFASLDERFRAFLAKHGTALTARLCTMTEARRAKYQNIIYHLEPNLKEAPGGLRDLQAVRWLSFLRRTGDAAGLTAPFDFLAAMRIRTHEFAGRDQNVVTFEIQDTLSHDPAALMREYYRHARSVDRAIQRAIEGAAAKDRTLLGRFYEWRSGLSTSEFTVVNDRVLLRAPVEPSQSLSLFEFLSRHRLRPAPDTIDRLAGFTPNANWDDWKRLLSSPHSSFGLRAMQDAGTLAAAIPEWRKIECLVVRDFYHRYTVDEHTLVAIASLESISDPRFADLFAELDQPALLRFALLLHDAGKGSGGDHVAASLQIANAVFDRLGVPAADRAIVEFLISRHLDLSAVMTSRDLSDGATAKALAARVEAVERLKLLTMLTYADISAVNPEAMTPWRLEQLWRVYLLAHEELTRELHAGRIHDAAGVPPDRAAFLEGLPVRYLRTHLPAEVDSHFNLARQLKSRPVAIEITHQRGIYHLTLLTRDRPGLFASVAGAISSFGLSIVKAEAFANAQGIVVDTFTFSDPHRTLELNPPEVDRLRGIVRKVVEGKQDASQLLRGRPKPLLPSRAARIKPRVAVSNEASEAATLIEIVAEDRPGLLYDLGRAISAAGCDIEVVLIDTEAHKALDVFYVTASGKKLEADRGSRLKADLLAACSGS
jgi:[protein-PII] uridylyltransferase